MLFLKKVKTYKEIISLRHVAAAVLMLMFSAGLYAYNMRQYSSYHGLSNSAILSLSCDDNGFLWLGTCDGVNISDGSQIYPFEEIYPGASLSGNIIETIFNGHNNNVWVLTNYGLDQVDTNRRTVKTFPQFHGQEKICSDDKGNIYVLSEDLDIHMFNQANDSEFRKVGHIDHKFTDVRTMMIRNGELWFVASDGIYVYTVPEERIADSAVLKADRTFRNITSVFAKAQGDKLFIVSPEGYICEVLPRGTVRKIAGIADSLSGRGRISNMVQDRQGNFFISFFTDGVLIVDKINDKQYKAKDLGLRVGVFCLEASPSQNVVWIGSDCQGVYTYWDDQYSIRSYNFNAFNNVISHPVRSVFYDRDNTLWLGTKGDGLLKLSHVDEFNDSRSLEGGELFTSQNSELWHNSVYSISRSSRPILWIGTDEGLNYYSYADNKLHKIRLNPVLTQIHGVCETNDSVLWMCTLGGGVARARIGGTAAEPQLNGLEVFKIQNGNISSNQFFSMTKDTDGRMLFCNRGHGMFEIRNGKLSPIPMKNDFESNTMNDVFDALKWNDTLWLGTGQGLVKQWNDGTRHYYGIQYGFNNNTIHEMLKTEDGAIWMSTNNGIVSFNPGNDMAQSYGLNYGLEVTEYSDGAGFNTGKSLIFGGVNGITFISRQENYNATEPYMPRLQLLKLSISGMDVAPVDFLVDNNGKDRISLASNQNQFELTVSAPDFINANSYAYLYSFDGVSWINNGSRNVIGFNEMSHGTYKLAVKYVNVATGVESEPYEVSINIEAPWYLTKTAKFCYVLALIAALWFGIYLYLRNQKRKQREKMIMVEQAHREEVYEEKLKFFTNITHEFCTPLTLMYGPCERIQDYPGSDDYIRKYVGLIRTNAERLNALIQELIDFRRVETGNKILKPAMVDVSELSSEIFMSFLELAERNNINFVNEIDRGIEWPSDFSCVRKVLTNLISNAFKYTPTGGTIKVKVNTDAGLLRISVYNTGKGIREEDKEKIFNRYSILDNVEENAVKGLSSRNGLGMAICHSMVDMLSGSIDIESEVGKFAEFIISLPPIDLPESDHKEVVPELCPGDKASVPADNSELPIAVKTDKKEQTEMILVVDDHEAILSLLEESLSGYEVVTAKSVDKALEIIKNTMPSLIISDIMMPGTDGLTFTQMIKGNKHTMHIPLILLSAKTSNEERVSGIESGADAYISKPFSITYLKAVIKRMLENRRHLREYYNSSASAYEYNEGRLLHREDKDFMDGIMSYIDERIADSDLTPDDLARHMKISSRNLYRKFKELEQLPPNDFIKFQRITYAAKLLVTTAATVQEVIYKSGFTNRSHFYKEFDKRFGMTPKDYRSANSGKDTSLQ